MPVQDLGRWTGGSIPSIKDKHVLIARVTVFGLAAALTALGTYEIYQVVSPAGVTWLQVVFAILFALTFAWIAFACVSALYGFALLTFTRAKSPGMAPLDKSGLTAIVMPVYNESPERIFATLGRMARGLADEGAGRHFEIVILSDTRDETVARREEELFTAFRMMLGDSFRAYYRRRAHNHHKKAGNIADFVSRFGGRYDHMVVLDADSDMEPSTLIALARTMAADASAGIIQTLPLLRNRWTPFARMTQFAGRVYGPVVAAGLCAWHGRDGNFWGHNAIIRTAAFAASAGLPELEGRKPFGGHILSHDFIEAALMRRAGWSVYMLPQLGGSYEETPPSLMDLATRDRRWSQGNLQHLKILRARRLHWASRVHLLQGIMSYLASPLWLMMLVAGLVLATVARYTEPNYFPDGLSLFPAWPVFDPERALRLFGITLAVLYLPKQLGLINAMRSPETRSGCGGALGLINSFVAETVLSMLLSPVMMLIQTRFVFDVFMGRDSGWNTQNRDEGAEPFKALLFRHFVHALAGLVFGALAFAISDDTFFWFLPVMAGLVLAPAVSWATSLPALGEALWHLNVFRIPEEQLRHERAPGTEAGIQLQPAE